MADASKAKENFMGLLLDPEKLHLLLLLSIIYDQTHHM
jgi:hypothetical protein